MSGPIPPTPLRVAICTANFGRGVSAERFEANFLRVIKALSDSADHWLLGCQEIDEADAPNEHAIIRRLLPHAKLVGFTTHTPIIGSFRTNVVKEKVSRASTGVPRLSPSRQVVDAIFEIEGIELGFVNTHFPRWTRRLISRWHLVKGKLKRRIRRLRRRGVPVAWSADVNVLKLKRLGKRERRLVSWRRDYLGIFPAWGKRRTHWRVVDRRRVDLNIDGHDAHIVVLELEAS